MSLEQALRATGAGPQTATAQAPLAAVAMREVGITTQRRARYFIAQVMHESGGLFYREELASGDAYEGRSDLGNTHPGDGRRYKGRGWIQLTGRGNYREAGRALGLPLESNPDLASTSKVAWRIAAWYWKTRGLNELADSGNFDAVTRRINGGTNGAADRRRRLGLLANVDARPVAPRPLKLDRDQAEAREVLLRKRRIAKRAGGWGKVDPSHRREAEKAVAFLRAEANKLAGAKVVDTGYRDRKVLYLRDLALARGAFAT
jgi:predicted chitinase